VMMLRYARTNIPPKPRSTRWDRRSVTIRSRPRG
jgi:hypothetical protein